jgi:hypothetical protein
MESKDIVPGKEYAPREASVEGGEFQYVRAIERVRGSKWRVEWIEPNPGLVDYAKSIAFICPWSERKKVAKDERNAARLKEEIAKSWPGEYHPLDNAVNAVLDSTGEDLIVYRGILSGPLDMFERVAARAGLQWSDGVNSYTDRYGKCHHSWNKALELAKAFAAAEPHTVLLHIDIKERNLEIEAAEPGYSYLLSLLEEYRAAWAIVRQWASFDADKQRLHEEIKRLRDLLDQTVWKLRTSKDEPERVANWLSRAIKGG